MIRDVASGNLALAYNVDGSYAKSRLPEYPSIRIILFDDYMNVMLRTALIPKKCGKSGAKRHDGRFFGEFKPQIRTDRTN